MADVSYKLFGIVSCLVALAIAAAAFVIASHLGKSEVRDNATSEAKTVVAVTSGFVRTYTQLQGKLEHGMLPNPARFRAMSLHRVDEGILDRGGSTSVVGLPGKEIANAATDETMRLQIMNMLEKPDIGVLASTQRNGSQITHRTLVPFFASEPGCVNCHNKLQNLTGDKQWRMGDLMGAQYVEQDIAPQLSKINRTIWAISALVFLTVVASSYCLLFLFRYSL